jgi:hypothetical protein
MPFEIALSRDGLLAFTQSMVAEGDTYPDQKYLSSYYLSLPILFAVHFTCISLFAYGLRRLHMRSVSDDTDQ